MTAEQRAGRRSDVIAIRAMAILTVMFGHSIILYSDSWNLYTTRISSPPLNALKDVINVIQMPLFFSVSGFCFLYTLRSGKAFPAFFFDKVRRILVPFVLIGLCWLYPMRLLCRYPEYIQQTFWHVFVWDILIGKDNGHLWFLPTLFVMLMLTWAICGFVRCRWLADGLLIMVGVGAMVMVPAGKPYVSQFADYYIYFVLGLFIHQHEDMLRRWLQGPLRILLAAGAVAMLTFYLFGMRRRLFVVVTAALVVLAVYLLMPNKVNAVTRAISRNSMGMYLFHSPLLYLSFAYWPDINPLLMMLINFVGFGALAYGMTNAIRKLGLGLMIGE